MASEVKLRKLANEIRNAAANNPGFSWTLVGYFAADVLDQIAIEKGIASVKMPDKYLIAREGLEREVASNEPGASEIAVEGLQSIFRSAKEHSPEWVTARRALNQIKELAERPTIYDGDTV